MAAFQTLLENCNSLVLDVYGESEQTDCVEAGRMVPYLIDSRRKQKVLWRQLYVLDAMMSLLEGLESPQQLLTQPCPPNPDNSARGRWKALKVQHRDSVEVIETLISTLQGRVEQINSKRRTLTQLVQDLQSKKKKNEQLEMSVQKAHNALRVCDSQLTQLGSELKAVLVRLGNCQLLKDELQGYVSATQDVMQCKIQSVSQSELSVELRPRPCGVHSSNKLEPLTLSITWNHDDYFQLQVNQGTAGMEEKSVHGRLSELSTALVEVMQCYTSQGDMLAEIQALHCRFAIDWRPQQRLLLFLKTASVVCFLNVENGYPVTGQAKLLSIRKDSQPINLALIQPPKESMSLTEWLTFLEESPVV